MPEQIKETDIMIGNFFHVNGYPMYVDAIFRDTVYLEFEGNEADPWEENIKDLIPIPLTEDILLKAGFEKENEDDKYGRVFLIPNTKYIIRIVNYGNPQSEDFGYSLEISDDKDWCSIKRIYYIHDLQNTIFALTGEEIKMEL